MSGMLPGVEVARRRRIHQRGGWLDSPATVAYGSFRRASLCSNSRSHNAHQYSSSSVYEDDGKLGGAAREAKERLDERLRAQIRRVSGTTRQEHLNTESSRSSGESRPELVNGDQPRTDQVVSALKKGVSKRFINWTGLIHWRDTEQEECVVCLERFKSEETLMHLPCAHRFHSGCLVPWLENNAHCPCCRTMVPS